MKYHQKSARLANQDVVVTRFPKWGISSFVTKDNLEALGYGLAITSVILVYAFIQGAVGI